MIAVGLHILRGELQADLGGADVGVDVKEVDEVRGKRTCEPRAQRLEVPRLRRAVGNLDHEFRRLVSAAARPIEAVNDDDAIDVVLAVLHRGLPVVCSSC